MKYSYIGVTRQKEEIRGTLEAPDEIEARMRLRAMQIRPTTLVQGERVFALKLPKLDDLAMGSPIDLKGMVVFTRQFSSLVDSGVPIVQCLDILWQQERRPRFKRILAKVKGDLESGSGLGEALGRHPRVFS